MLFVAAEFFKFFLILYFIVEDMFTLKSEIYYNSSMIYD